MKIIIKKSSKHKNTVIKIHAGDSITLAFLAHWDELGYNVNLCLVRVNIIQK